MIAGQMGDFRTKIENPSRNRGGLTEDKGLRGGKVVIAFRYQEIRALIFYILTR
jgi:hypothetical protein